MWTDKDEKALADLLKRKESHEQAMAKSSLRRIVNTILMSLDRDLITLKEISTGEEDGDKFVVITYRANE